MSVFVDASALIALITHEPEALRLADALEDQSPRFCSAVAACETVAGLCRSYAFSIPQAQERVRLFLDELDISFVPIGEPEFALASEAYARLGKGRHPAALNMGDCFAYACARANRASLLFKGDDFTATDIERCAE